MPSKFASFSCDIPFCFLRNKRYVSIYITVTTPQQKLRLVEKVYYSDDKELLGYELFSRHVLAVPQVYCVDFDKKVLLMDEVTDSVQGNHFNEDSESWKFVLKEIAKVHAAFWESENVFEKIGLDVRHELCSSGLLLAI